MSTLDCNTPVGRAWIARQHQIVDVCKTIFRCEAVTTFDDGDAPVDVLFARRNTLIAVAEIKNRALTLAGLNGFGSYVVTLEKLLRGRAIAQVLRVPYVLVVGLTDAVVHWTVTDARGDWLIDFDVAHTATQATCNGGSAVRANAYLQLGAMKVHPLPETTPDAGDRT